MSQAVPSMLYQTLKEQSNASKFLQLITQSFLYKKIIDHKQLCFLINQSNLNLEFNKRKILKENTTCAHEASLFIFEL